MVGKTTACLFEDFATLDALKDVLPDLVILDIRGDRPHTLQLLRTLKADKDTQDIPVIVCVAFPQELTDDRAWLQTNSIGVLDKPFDLDDLCAAIDHCLIGVPNALDNRVAQDRRGRAERLAFGDAR